MYANKKALKLKIPKMLRCHISSWISCQKWSWMNECPYHTVWKSWNFSASQILRENNFNELKFEKLSFGQLQTVEANFVRSIFVNSSSTKLISRKIWGSEKFSNFHNVICMNVLIKTFTQYSFFQGLSSCFGWHVGCRPLYLGLKTTWCIRPSAKCGRN